MRRFFIDESVKPASLYVIDGGSFVAEAHEIERSDATVIEKVELEPKLEPEETGKKVRRCGNCGKPGHQARTCPNNKKGEEAKAEDDKETDPEEQELVYDIRSKFVIQGKAPMAVANELNISLERFLKICKKHDIHR